jgi:serine/threonine protein kinase
MDQYKIEKRISDGAFGTVYKAHNLHHDKPNNKVPPIVAIKQVYSSSQNLKRELRILKKLPKHPNIVEIYDTFDENFTTSIIMEKGKSDLADWISDTYYPVSENTIKNIAHQVLQGLATIHNADIIHRDLKPSNLIIGEKNNIAICDFGSAVDCTKGEEYEI